MLLNIYLGTTAISWATNFIFALACSNKLKREGYEFVNEKKSISEKIASFISTAFKSSIPVYNIINTIVVLCMGDKLYGYLEEKLLVQGKIYKPAEEKLGSDCECPNLNQEVDKTYTESVEKTKKTYYEMTVEEKLAYLQQEREKLIDQSTVQVEDSFTANKRRR